MQLPTTTRETVLRNEWNADALHTVKRMKRSHDAKIINLQLPVEKVTAEVSGVEFGGEILPSATLAVSKPYFEATWPTNVSVILGQPAVLKCRTRLLGERMV